jgi:oligopeptide transport system substrate-binding protein
MLLRRILLLSCAVLVASALIGCGKGQFAQGKTQSGSSDVLRYAIATNPTTLDPGIVQDIDTMDIILNVYEGLVSWDENNRIKPQLAERWDVEEEGRVYVFHLRRDVKFHNGRPLTAEDFKWTLERNCDPSFGSPIAENYLGDIVGVADKISGRSKEISGIEVVDEHTLRIRIDKPRPYFLGKLTYPVAYVLAKEGAPDGREVSSAEGAIGTGPFKFERYLPEQVTVLVANEDYYEGAPQVAKIERPVVKDAATRLNQYRAGNADLLALPRQDIKAIQDDASLKSHLEFIDRPAVFYLGLNPAAYKPFEDVRVRRAFAMAIDKEALVRDILAGLNNPAHGIVPPGVPGHREDVARVPFDPQAARKLLAEAGYADGSKLPTLMLAMREQAADSRLVCEAIWGQLQKNLGVNVDLRAMEWRTLLEKRNKRELPMWFGSWYADYLDPENFLSFLFAGYGPENRVGYKNPRFDALVSEADSVLDMDRRLPLYAQAEDIVVQDVAWIPLYFVRDAQLVHPRVKGLRRSGLGYLPHTAVTLE